MERGNVRGWIRKRDEVRGGEGKEGEERGGKESQDNAEVVVMKMWKMRVG